MEYVEPIRNKTDIEVMKRILKKRNLRDYALFVLGINSGLRISDMLGLKIKDVTHASKRTRIADRIRIREQKTGKAKDFPINEPAKKGTERIPEEGKHPARSGSSTVSIQEG
jgi:integrase